MAEADVLLGRARSGDDRAFGELTDPYRRELRLHCYRILGSLTDAEDLLQETLVAAWQGLTGFEGRASVRAWLYRIATNRCLNAVRDRARRPPEEPLPPFEPPPPTHRSEVTWLQPYPDSLLPEQRYERREAVELAFITALQRLPPRQAATLVLRDVLGYSTEDVAGMLDTTTTAVKGALQRARATLAVEQPPRPGSAEERLLGERFAEAFSAYDVEALVDLLTDDAWLAMPPAPHEYHGVPALVSFLRASDAGRGGRRLTLLPTRANTQPAYGCYLAGDPAGLMVLTLRGDRIHGLTRFLTADLPLFDLPAQA
jgi:RNA polymerase sigma-70 factor (TIGR02960 family)